MGLASPCCAASKRPAPQHAPGVTLVRSRDCRTEIGSGAVDPVRSADRHRRDDARWPAGTVYVLEVDEVPQARDVDMHLAGAIAGVVGGAGPRGATTGDVPGGL